MDGTVRLHIDVEAYDFHVDTLEEFDQGWLNIILTTAEWWGLEPLEEDECPAELLPNGGTRIYLTPLPARVDRLALGVAGILPALYVVAQLAQQLTPALAVA
jgi:hypothetical protein